MICCKVCKQTDHVSLCGLCKTFCYCCSACQTNDWNRHYSICSLIAAKRKREEETSEGPEQKKYKIDDFPDEVLLAIMFYIDDISDLLTFRLVNKRWKNFLYGDTIKRMFLEKYGPEKFSAEKTYEYRYLEATRMLDSPDYVSWRFWAEAIWVHKNNDYLPLRNALFEVEQARVTRVPLQQKSIIPAAIAVHRRAQAMILHGTVAQQFRMPVPELSLFRMLRTLKMSSMGIERFPEEIVDARLPVLKEWNLANNRLRSVSNRLDLLPSLRILDLSGNYIDEIPLNVVKSMQHLKSLDLSKNYLLEQLGSGVFVFKYLENIEKLFLNRCEHLRIPLGIPTLKRLRFFGLENVPLYIDQLVTISSNLESLEEIWVSDSVKTIYFWEESLERMKNKGVEIHIVIIQHQLVQ